MESFLTDERFSNGKVCPLCGCTHIVRNGHRKDGAQKYMCKDCGKSFVITTNSIVFGTHKDLDTWQKYIDCMRNGFSVRKTAFICGIHKDTAFIWRHKVLDALQNMAESVNLEGIIETDETFFAISYKGNHTKSTTFTMPRVSYKRGHSSHLRGLSLEKVCVPCAVLRERPVKLIFVGLNPAAFSLGYQWYTIVTPAFYQMVPMQYNTHTMCILCSTQKSRS